MSEPFGGDKKEGKSLLHPFEDRFIKWAVVRIPSWIQSYQLTLMTIPISLGMILFGYLAQDDFRWFWGSSVLIALQWLTDSLDGSLGRLREMGLARWGYYMDHFLDYIFLCSMLIGYLFSMPHEYRIYQFFLLAIFGAFMVNSYLAFAVTNRLKIMHLGIGPTEIRIAFIFVNILLATIGQTHLAWLLPFLLWISLGCLIFVVYQTHTHIWNEDMQAKKRSD